MLQPLHPHRRQCRTGDENLRCQLQDDVQHQKHLLRGLTQCGAKSIQQVTHGAATLHMELNADYHACLHTLLPSKHMHLLSMQASNTASIQHGW